jgi:ribose transport system substrate-binding protein
MSVRRYTGLAAALGVAIALAGCGSSGGGSSSGGSGSGGSAAAGPYSFYLSNNFIGNDWRQQMAKTAALATKLAPFSGKVKLTTVNDSDPGVPTQLSNLNNIVPRKPAAILIDAASPNALNPTVTRACSAKIVVVSFDQNVSAPCAYNVTPTFETTAYDGTKWLIKHIGGKGTVLVDQGTPGDPNSVTLTAGINKALAQSPGIKVGGKYASDYGIGQTEQGIASLLSSNPDVKGVLALGPNCGAVLTAFQTAHRPAPAVFCTGAGNGALVQCAKTKGAACYDGAFPPYVVTLAMRIALNVLKGVKEPHITSFVPPCIVTGGDTGCSAIKLGVNAYPDKPAGLTFPISPSWLPITVNQLG